MSRSEYMESGFDKWRDGLSAKELLHIFFESFDPESIEEYLREWYEKEVIK